MKNAKYYTRPLNPSEYRINVNQVLTTYDLPYIPTLPSLPTVQIGNAPAVVQFAGLISPGLYQFNVVVPASIAVGDNSVIASYGGTTAPAGTLITVQR